MDWQSFLTENTLRTVLDFILLAGLAWLGRYLRSIVHNIRALFALVDAVTDLRQRVGRIEKRLRIRRSDLETMDA